MIITNLGLSGIRFIHSDPINDERGCFRTTYNREEFEKAGIPTNWILENRSYNKHINTMRGLHFQTGEFAQAKLISVLEGAIIDIAVDIREDSPTYGQYERVLLMETVPMSLYIPRGFAHGYITTVEHTEVEYKVDNVYSPEHESGLRFDDSDLAINLSIDFLGDCDSIMSEKDKSWGNFKDLKGK